MKKLAFTIFSIISILIFSSCKSENANPVAKDITDSIVSNFSTDSMSELTAERVGSYYEIDLNKLEDFSIYIEGSGGFADEVAVFKAKSTDAIDEIKQSISDRIEKRKMDFENYNSEELTKIEDNLVVVKGKYILFVISDNNDKANDVFQSAFK